MSENEGSQDGKIGAIKGIADQLGRPLTSDEEKAILAGEPPFKILHDAADITRTDIPTTEESIPNKRVTSIIGVENQLGRELTPTERARILTGKPAYEVLDNAITDPTIEMPVINPAHETENMQIKGVEEQLGRKLTYEEREKILTGVSPYEIMEKAVTDPTIEMAKPQIPGEPVTSQENAPPGKYRGSHRKVTKTDMIPELMKMVKNAMVTPGKHRMRKP